MHWCDAKRTTVGSNCVKLIPPGLLVYRDPQVCNRLSVIRIRMPNYPRDLFDE